MKTKLFSQKVMVQLSHSHGTVIINGKWNDDLNDFEADLVFEVLYNEQIDTTRWNSVHDLVFIDKNSKQAYYTRYEQGLTESQMLEPFYYDRDGVECDIVDVWEEEETIKVLKWKPSK